MTKCGVGVLVCWCVGVLGCGVDSRFRSDDHLFEYIMLLISNNRGKQHVCNDLEAFFGEY